METRFVETFLLVATHGSMAEAARRLGLTPTAVDQRIRALEAEIGHPLIARAGRAVKLTPSGQAIVEEGRALLAQAGRLKAAAGIDELAGELRLGAITTALTGLLPAAMRRLSETLPKVEVFLLPGPSTELYRAVEEGRLDGAILVRPPFALPKTLAWRDLRAEPMLLLAPGHHAGADPMALLRRERFIRYDRGNWGGRLAAQWLKAQGIRPRDWLELDQLEAIAVMVSNGLGISIVPDWAPPWPEGLDVARLPLPGAPVSRQIGLVWARERAAARLMPPLIASLSGP